MQQGNKNKVRNSKSKIRNVYRAFAKEFKIKSGYGMVKLIQKSVPADLTEPDNTLLSGINLVTLTAQWQHAALPRSKQIQFYVYRPG